MSRALCSLGVAAIAALVLAGRATAQDSRLERLDPEARAGVTAVVDSAHAAGLPIEPLVDRALEGATKRAPPDLVVAAVRRLAAHLGRARAVLGPASLPPEIEAGAAALRAGVDPAVLAALRSKRPRQPLTVPLSVLADLVASGVPPDTAAAAVLALAPITEDGALMEFRRNVERDIALGAPPAAAAAVRVTAGDALNAVPEGAGGRAQPQQQPRRP
jgi:hypothetical protein